MGQARITQYTRYLTVGLAFAQSIGYVFLFKSLDSQAGATLIPNFNVGKVLLIVVSLIAGTVLLMWMGALITQRGIGNGISLLILASIVARLLRIAAIWWSGWWRAGSGGGAIGIRARSRTPATRASVPAAAWGLLHDVLGVDRNRALRQQRKAPIVRLVDVNGELERASAQ